MSDTGDQEYDGSGACFDIVVFNEREWHGPSGGGPGHWHVFEVAAFR